MKKMIAFIWCMMITLFISVSFAQAPEKKPVGDEIYAIYKKDGVDKALAKYHSMKKKESEKYLFNERQLNRMGYIIMEEDRDMAAAKKVFLLNMEEYPEAPNPKDSYGDYLVKAGDNEQAKKYYRMSIEANERLKEPTAWDKNVLITTRSKLAKLENKHRSFDFLLGNWEMRVKDFNDPNGKVQVLDSRFEYLEDEVVLVGNMNDPVSSGRQTILITYNAIEDEYQLISLFQDRLTGFNVTKGKMINNGNGSYIINEEYEENGEKYLLRHHIKKVDKDKIEWWGESSKDEGKTWNKSFELAYLRK